MLRDVRTPPSPHIDAGMKAAHMVGNDHHTCRDIADTLSPLDTGHFVAELLCRLFDPCVASDEQISDWLETDLAVLDLVELDIEEEPLPADCELTMRRAVRKGACFSREEVHSSFVAHNERFVCSYIVGYEGGKRGDQVKSANEAAVLFRDLVTDTITVYVHDRLTGKTTEHRV